MSRSVDGSEQGLLQGANSSVMGVANLFGPILFTQIFALAIGGEHGVPGAPFLLATLLLAAAAVVAWFATRK
jgi:DHA1 family tetracycline resistance protein-like MFS transporter